MHSKSGHTSMVLLLKCKCTPYTHSTGQWLLNSCKLENDSNQFVPTSLYLCELLKEHHTTNPLCFIMNKISRMVNFIFYFYLSTCEALGSFGYQWYSMWWLFTFHAFKETHKRYFTKVFWQLVPNTVGLGIKRMRTLRNDELTTRRWFLNSWWYGQVRKFEMGVEHGFDSWLFITSKIVGEK